MQSGSVYVMSDSVPYAALDELSAGEFRAALDAAKHEAEQIREDFIASRPSGSLAYDAEWTMRYGSQDRLIFVFAVVLHLEENFDVRDYPYDITRSATADLRKRLIGTKVDDWGPCVVTVRVRPKASSLDS